MKVYICYNDPKQIKEFEESDIDSSNFHFIDENTLRGRREGRKLRSKFGSYTTPFAVIYNSEDCPVKGFWKEASKNPIKDLINYLSDENNQTLRYL